MHPGPRSRRGSSTRRRASTRCSRGPVDPARSRWRGPLLHRATGTPTSRSERAPTRPPCPPGSAAGPSTVTTTPTDSSASRAYSSQMNLLCPRGGRHARGTPPAPPRRLRTRWGARSPGPRGSGPRAGTPGRTDQRVEAEAAGNSGWLLDPRGVDDRFGAFRAAAPASTQGWRTRPSAISPGVGGREFASGSAYTWRSAHGGLQLHSGVRMPSRISSCSRSSTKVLNPRSHTMNMPPKSGRGSRRSGRGGRGVRRRRDQRSNRYRASDLRVSIQY